MGFLRPAFMFVYDAIYLADDVVFTSQLYIAPKYTEKYNAFYN